LIARGGDRRTEVEDYKRNWVSVSRPRLLVITFPAESVGHAVDGRVYGEDCVFREALRQGYVWLVVLAVINTAISAYYYLRLIIVMFYSRENHNLERAAHST